ncbi:MAG: hypothetical protein K9M84_09975 [Spirochaetia bacterium]|nr:hypothetical protein [Spirochaetia bacterium]
MNLIMQQAQRTLIRISPETFPIPKSLLQRSHEQGYLIRGETITPWQWYGFTVVDSDRYIYTDTIELLPLQSIFSADLQVAVRQLKLLAHALGELDRQYPDQGLDACFSLRSIYLAEDGGILVLPSSIRDLIEASQDESELFETKGQWCSPRVTGHAAPAYQLTCMAYAILTSGPSPIRTDRVRNDEYQAVPITLLRPELPQQTRQWFDARLSRKPEGDSTVGAWITSFEQLPSVDLRPGVPAVSHPELDLFISRQEKRAARKRSLRIHSLRNKVIAVIAIVALALIVSVVQKLLEPPATAGMTAQEVVEFYYDCHNRLDSVSMGDALANGVKSEAESSLTYMYVTTTVRSAYEGTSGFISAPEWVESGMPALESSVLVYGITELSLEWIDERRVRASYLLWNPVIPEEGIEREVPAEAVRIVEELQLQPSGDTWEITAIRRTSSEPVN